MCTKAAQSLSLQADLLIIRGRTLPRCLKTQIQFSRNLLSLTSADFRLSRSTMEPDRKATTLEAVSSSLCLKQASLSQRLFFQDSMFSAVPFLTILVNLLAATLAIQFCLNLDSQVLPSLLFE